MKQIVPCLLLVLANVTFSLRAAAPVVINEIMASNTRSVPDVTDFDDYPDWLELKNTTAAPVNLNGYFLSDNPSNPFKWQIPAGATVPPNGFLIIFADGHDAAPGETFPRDYWPWHNFVTEKYHANFSLSSLGESVTLSQGLGLGSASLVNAAVPTPVAPATAAVWKYKDNGTNLSTQWRARNYDDSTWASGPAKLGYGDPAATTVSYGPSSGNKFITTYFRHHFTVADPTAFHGLSMRLLVDDGCVVYLNGDEVARRNMPDGAVDYKTLATVVVGGTDETNYFNYTIPASSLVAGDNVIAVEVHQADATSSDLGFDLGLTGLTHTGINTIDTIAFTEQVPDVSFGRDPADPTVWKQFAVPTPGADNTTPVVNNVRVSGNAVTVSLPGGLYSSDQTVTLSAPGGVIHYTLDGKNPTLASPIYSSPIAITATTVVRARCFEDGKAPGPIVTRTYFRGETQTNVPYVSVVADPETLFGDTIGIYKNLHEPVDGSYGLHDVYKNKDAPGNVEFFAPNGTSFNAGVGIRIGGENNWVHPQKALNISIVAKYGTDGLTYDLFPGSKIPTHTSFTLRDGGDNWNKEMLRDCLFAKLAHGYLAADTADYRPSIVFINGAYYGLHDVRQRWDEAWFFGQYNLPADKIDHLIYGHETSNAITLGAQKGDTSNWLDLMSFINTANLTVQTNWDYVESKIDMDSFMDFVISESYGNNDSWAWNREFWRAKNPGAKWKWFLPDMDRTFGLSSPTGILSDLLASEDVLKRLKANTGFKQRLAQRYAAHMAATFKPSRVQGLISQMDTEISALVARHAARWAPNGMTVSGRASNIQEIKDYATTRATNVYNEISTDLGVGSTVNLTLSVDAAQGKVLVQGVPVDASTFKMFANIPITLQAVAAPGFVFNGWTGAAGGETTSVTLSGAATIAANFAPSGETVLGGTLSADTTLTAAASPYSLSSDLIIPAGVTVTVQPGVTINMPTARNIRVQGVFNIAGTAAQPVTIRGRGSDRWGGISYETPSGPSSLAHLIVRGATKGYDPVLYPFGISGRNVNLTIDFLDMTDSEQPVIVNGGSCTIRDSVLYSTYIGDSLNVKNGVAVVQRCIFPGNNMPDTDAIDFGAVTSALVEDCKIYHFSGFNSDGIDMGEKCQNVVLIGNVIYYNDDKGVSIGGGSQVTMRRNLIVGCADGIGVKDGGTKVVADQNTFVDNDRGVAVYEKVFGRGGAEVYMTNCIISKSTTMPVSADAYSIFGGAYNLSDTLPMPGANNLLADPMFVDPAVLNYQLQASSPAINAGDPAHALDPDGTRADIGAMYHYSTNDYPYTIGQTVVINEILANSGTNSDWIELHNRTAAAINIGGWFLSDDGSDLQKYRIPFGTIIPANGYVVYYEDANFGVTSVDTNKVTGFALSDVGETVYLSSAVNDQLTEYRTKEDFGPSLEGETLGTYYKSSSDSYNFIAMKTPTPGAPNSAPRVGPIVISEIMYHPAGSGTGDAEYIELLNISSAPVTLYDSVKAAPWRITDGIDFEFPSATPLTMAAGERIVLTKNKTLFNSVYGALVPDGTKVLEWGIGSLDNGGETLQLDRPGAVNASNVVQYVRVDRVNYEDASPWPTTPDGHGPSLNRVLESEYGNDFSNWMAASPSPGKPNVQAAPDSDGDGIPDAYETLHGMNPFDRSDAALDFDGDGQSNLAEYLAGTDPQIADNLRINFVIDAGTPTVGFTAVAGQTYSIQYKASLTDSVWLKLNDVSAQPSNTQIQITDPSGATLSQRYYRVVTPQQP